MKIRPNIVIKNNDFSDPLSRNLCHIIDTECISKPGGALIFSPSDSDRGSLMKYQGYEGTYREAVIKEVHHDARGRWKLELADEIERIMSENRAIIAIYEDIRNFVDKSSEAEQRNRFIIYTGSLSNELLFNYAATLANIIDTLSISATICDDIKRNAYIIYTYNVEIANELGIDAESIMKSDIGNSKEKTATDGKRTARLFASTTRIISNGDTALANNEAVIKPTIACLKETDYRFIAFADVEINGIGDDAQTKKLAQLYSSDIIAHAASTLCNTMPFPRITPNVILESENDELDAILRSAIDMITNGNIESSDIEFDAGSLRDISSSFLNFVYWYSINIVCSRYDTLRDIALRGSLTLDASAESILSKAKCIREIIYSLGRIYDEYFKSYGDNAINIRLDGNNPPDGTPEAYRDYGLFLRTFTRTKKIDAVCCGVPIEDID